MGRKLILVLLGLVLLVLALDAGGVLPLGILGGDTAADGDGETDLLGVDGEGGEAAGLKGLGAHGAKKADGTALVAEPSQPAEVRGTTPGGGVVRGRVVQQDGGIPLRGIAVHLTRFDSLLSYLRAQVNDRYDVLLAETDANGRFAFLDVTPSDDYVVRVQAEGFAVTSSDELDLRGRETIDVGDLAVGPGAKVSGRVLDHEGKPAVGVRVAATWMITNGINVILTDPDTAPALQMETTTDEEGRYALEHLEPTDTTLFFVAPSGAAEIVRKLGFDELKTVELPDVTLPGPRFVAGTVAWSDGTPIADARVFATGALGGAVRPTDAAADGSWRIDYIPGGDKTNLGVLVPGMPVQMKAQVPIGRDDVRIEFPVPGKLGGTVVEAQSGEPVERFRIQLVPTKEPEDWTLRIVAKQVRRGLGATPFVSPEGRFAFGRVAPGTYKLTLTADGYPATKLGDIVVAAKETATIRIEVAEGFVARGTVRRSTGEPVKGARVYVLPGGRVRAGAQGPQLQGYIRDREPDAIARADGVFELPPQTPEHYDVIASLPGALPGVERGIDLRAGDAADVEIRLPPAGTVRGLMLDEHARPAKGETVFLLYRNGIVRTVMTGADGRFELTGMPVGRCLVRWLSLRTSGAHYRTYRSGTSEDKEKAYDVMRLEGEEHEIVDGEVVEVSLRLPRRVQVTGRLRVEGEVPKGETGFYITTSAGGHWVRVDLDAEGRFETRLLPGKYRAYMPVAKNSWAGVEIEIPDTPTHQLDLGQ